MPKAEWGVKRLCVECGDRYYDLGREPAICPNCGAEFLSAEAMAAKAKVRREAAKAAIDDEVVDDEDEDVVEDDDADDADDDADDVVADSDDDDDEEESSDTVLLDDDDDDDLDEFKSGDSDNKET
jgi:uncharacterized protein (TIGR02300 family)